MPDKWFPFCNEKLFVELWKYWKRLNYLFSGGNEMEMWIENLKKTDRRLIILRKFNKFLSKLKAVRKPTFTPNEFHYPPQKNPHFSINMDEINQFVSQTWKFTIINIAKIVRKKVIQKYVNFFKFNIIITEIIFFMHGFKLNIRWLHGKKWHSHGWGFYG